MFNDLVYKPYLKYNHVMEMLDSQPQSTWSISLLWTYCVEDEQQLKDKFTQNWKFSL